jgi:hypothetical protein
MRRKTMRTKWMSLWMTAAIALLCLPVGAHAQACAYAAVNGNCLLKLDRLNPVAPPTIYVRRGSHVTVLVTHPLPFEHLMMDLKSSAAQLPADQFRNGFTDITTALGGLEIIGGGPLAIEGGPTQLPPVCPDHTTSKNEIKDCQAKLKQYLTTNMKLNLKKAGQAPPQTPRPESEAAEGAKPEPSLNFGTWVYSRLCWVRSLFIPLPPSGVSIPQQSGGSIPVAQAHVCKDLPDGAAPPDISEAENDWTNWVDKFSDGSTDQLKFSPDSLEKTIDSLDADIADAKKARTISAGEYVTMNAGEQALHSALDTAAAYHAKMQGLLDAVTALKSDNEPNEFYISDVHFLDTDTKKEKVNEIQTWDLDTANKLARIAGQMKIDIYGDPLANVMGSLADAPTKQTFVEFQIEFLNEPRLEISSGLLVPIRPYHSYSEATPYSSATASTGSCTAGTTNAPSAPTNCPIVQQSSTIAVVPNVSFNILLGHELVLPDRQRGAWMWTITVGYNSATTSAAFGTGLSFSYRSMVFSFVPIVDQEQHLTGGFMVNQSAGTATTPTTTSSWKVNPAIGISLRIPLGGGTQ